MTSQEGKMQEKVDVEVGNEVGIDLSKTIVMEATTIRSDSRSEHSQKCEKEFTREMDCYGNICSESQPEINPIANSSLNSHVELSVPEDKCMVLAEESEFMRKELETEVNKHHYNPYHFKNKEESSVDASYDPACKGNCQVEEATVSENVYHIDLFNDIQSEASEDGCKESEGDNMTVPELGILPEELSMSNGKGNEEEIGL
ncbi:hypothetical protein OIU78_007259 [Salix suchowensis]|nr:hypothetical protein OIU78_007259 [Salix suchowensis]